MNINIGDCVRTEYGIAKIKSFETKSKEVINLDKDIMLCNMDCYRNCCTINQVMKSSPNIIDLIEVGDIITTHNLCGEITKIDGDKIYTTCYDGEYCSIEDIKSVVTKEQFESVEYKIER